jgi:hypothetical protein
LASNDNNTPLPLSDGSRSANFGGCGLYYLLNLTLEQANPVWAVAIRYKLSLMEILRVLVPLIQIKLMRPLAWMPA